MVIGEPSDVSSSKWQMIPYTESENQYKITKLQHKNL